MSKIALAVIVRDTEEEAQLLEKLLGNVSKHVDGVFITANHPKSEQGHIKKICEATGANYSYFKWIDDFSAAREFNFSQVPKEYDYIMWSDVDDVWNGLEMLKDTIEANPKDGYSFWYMYAFDEYGQPNVVHKKTMIIRNDGCAKWVGGIHEDLIPQRGTEIFFVDGIQRIHQSTEDRHSKSTERNERIAKKELKKNGGLDPRHLWNYGNALLASGKIKQAIKLFEPFIESSGSVEEKYIIRMRLAECYEHLREYKKAEEQYLLAIGERPILSDGFLNIGTYYYRRNLLDKAEEYLLLGLAVRKPNYHRMVVFNPRDYDYNPMMTLANVYFNKGRPDLALPVLEGCLKISPKNEYVRGLVEKMIEAKKKLEEAVDLAKTIEAESDLDKKKQMIESVPKHLVAHPAICMLRNKYFVKTESNGKEIAYYCGETYHEWNPVLFKTKGFGGSEEAVINLSREWAKRGYTVTVFNNCGPDIIEDDGVTYKPWWMFNVKDKYDAVILWRDARLVEHDINSPKVIVDLHDTLDPAELNDRRVSKIHKVMVKSVAQRNIYKHVPDDKFCIVPNGIDTSLFTEKVEKDQYLIINTSSPDRSLNALPGIFKKIKERVPQARLVWAYGWDNWDKWYGSDMHRAKFKEEVDREVAESGIEVLGRIPQHEVAKLYQKANILLYPTGFFEIDCISVRKAQLGGCHPITTDYGALETTNEHGTKIHIDKSIEDWRPTYQYGFGVTDDKSIDAFVDACVEKLNNPITDRSHMVKWAEQFNWANISQKWLESNGIQ